jgi:CHAT domain-containing protein
VVFYEELLAGRSKSLALRHAMLAMKKRYSDPVNWGAFTLIGTPD